MEQVAKTENEKKKEYLWGYKLHKNEVARIEAELEEIRLMKMYPTANNDGMPRGSTQSDLSDYAAALDSLERELIKERYLQIKNYVNIRKQIMQMEDTTERNILIFRYIKGMPWWKIAKEMNYSENWIYKIHGKALIHFELPKE